MVKPRIFLLRKKFILFSALLSILFVAAIYICDYLVANETAPYLFDDASSLTRMKCGLVLGTSKEQRSGRDNPYFTYRIDAAVSLYESGKVKHLIISGDNGHESYSEPDDMRLALIKRGIPDSSIHLDFAGFRTYDSVIRSKAIFDQDSIIIVSQPFHNERALYIAHHRGIYAQAYNAKDVGNRYGFRTQIREKLARVKLFLDLYILNTQPKFFGPKVCI